MSIRYLCTKLQSTFTWVNDLVIHIFYYFEQKTFSKYKYLVIYFAFFIFDVRFSKLFNKVNIHKYPEILEHQDQQITIGDLHANPLLLLHILIRHQIFKISARDYAKLVLLHKALDENAYQPDLYYQFLNIIWNAQVDKMPLIRFIGDEVADRMGNDLLMLFILKKLHDHQIPYRILISNHGLCFLSHYTALINHKQQMNPRLSPEFCPSFHVMATYIAKGHFELSMLKSMVTNAYLPHLELFDYSLNHHEVHIYTHGIVGMYQLNALANEYQIPWQDRDIITFASMLEQLQNHFKRYQLKQLLNDFDRTATISQAEFAQEIYRRKHSHLDSFSDNRNLDPQMMYRPEEHQGFFMKFVHGHHPEMNPPSNVISLDGQLGKHIKLSQGYLLEYLCSGEELVNYQQPHKKNSLGNIQNLLVPCLGLVACGYMIRQLQYIDHQFIVNWMVGCFDTWTNAMNESEFIRPKLTF